MEKGFFEIGIIGTLSTLKEKAMGKENIIVLDTEDTYGATYRSMKTLLKSKYIRDLKIRTLDVVDFLIEAFPYLISNKSEFYNKHIKKAFGGEIKFFSVSKIYYAFDYNNIIKFPMNKTEIVMSNWLTNEEKYYFNKSIKEKNIEIMREYIKKSPRNEKDLFYCMFFKSSMFSGRFFEEYTKNFGEFSYLYPVYGFSDVVENICLKNSMNGYTYFLNTNLKYRYLGKSANKENDVGLDVLDKEYPHVFSCEVGEVYCKQVWKEVLNKKSHYIRFIMLKEHRYNGSFVMWYDNKGSPIKIIGLDRVVIEKTEKRYSILYGISEEKEVALSDFGPMKPELGKIVTDLSFSTPYDINQFCFD